MVLGLCIDGQSVPPHGPVRELRNPATAQIHAEVRDATLDEVDAAVAAARMANTKMMGALPKSNSHPA